MVIYVLLVAHFVGDFICQSDWMAINKSKRADALALHVLAYMAVLLLFTVPFSAPPPDGMWPFVVFAVVNGVAHYVQDAITSRINARLWFIDGARVADQARVDVSAYFGAIGEISSYEAMQATWERLGEPGALEVAFNDKRHWFFVSIGADQLLHYVTLFVTASWWLQ